MTSLINVVPKVWSTRAGGVSVQPKRGPHRPGTPAVLMSRRVTPKVGPPARTCIDLHRHCSVMYRHEEGQASGKARQDARESPRLRVSAWDSLGVQWRLAEGAGPQRSAWEEGAPPEGALRKRWEELELRVERCHGPVTRDISPASHDIRPITTELRRGPTNNLPTSCWERPRAGSVCGSFFFTTMGFVWSDPFFTPQWVLYGVIPFLHHNWFCME